MGKNYNSSRLVNGLSVDASGNVGVGGSPSGSYKFEVTGNLLANGTMTLANDGTYGTTYKTLGFTGNSNGSHRIFAGTADDLYIAAATGRGVYIWTDGTSTTRMRILANGNVGIGTSSPSGLLTLAKNNNIAISTTDGSDDGYLAICGAGGDGSTRGGHIYLSGNERGADAGSAILSAGNVSGAFVGFRTGADIERMRITSAGNVGIGTSSPLSLLQLTGNNATVYDPSVDSGQDDGGVTLTIRNNDTSTVGSFSQIDMMVSGDSGRAVGRIVTIRTASATSDMAFVTENANTKAERMRITSGGYVCINSTSANGDGLLSISANVTLNQGITIKSIGSQTGLYYIYFQNSSSGIAGRIEQTSSTSVNYTSGSDYRLKENIKPLENSIERLMKLKPCEFIWKEDQIKGEGFIAHELQEIVPSAVVGKKDEVDKNGNPVYQGIDASKMVHLLVSAIQEQQTLIQELSAKVSALENKS